MNRFSRNAMLVSSYFMLQPWPVLARDLDILPVGPDTFTIAAPVAIFSGGDGSLDGARKAALTQALAYCTKNSKEFLVTNMTSSANRFEAIFRCLAKGDPDLQRPNIQQTPTVIIQDDR